MAKTDNSTKFWWVVSAAVVAGLILAFLSSDIVRNFVYLIIQGLWVGIVWFFTTSFSLPVWVATFFAGVGIYAVIRFISYVREKRRKESIAYRTSFVHFRRDVFDGVAWTWNYNNKGQVIDLVPSCDYDGTPMQYESAMVTKANYNKQVMVWLRCPSCNRRGPSVDGNNKGFIETLIVKEIQRKIYKKEYLKSITRRSPPS